MGRKSGSAILQEELYPAGAARARDDEARAEIDDARLIDLDVNEESPFLRAQKRVPARKSSLPRKTASRLLWAVLAAGLLCLASIAAAALYRYGEHSWRFRVESSDNIDVAGMQNVTKAQIMEVMGADIGRNIFFIPLAQQKVQLEQIPWVESASVMRFAPNRLRVEIHERTPVAFARVGPRIFLIDAGGTLMELPKKNKYSFPVILGMNPGEPLSTRLPRMKAYGVLMRDLDAEGAHYSQDLSEVDLSDLDNLKVRVNDPAGDVLVELGSSDFLRRYRTFITHAQEWRQQFQKLESVSLRFDNQVIVNPDLPHPAKVAGLSPAAARAAAAAGVKPAALTTRLPVDRSVPKPAFELPEKKDESKTAAPGSKKVSVAKSGWKNSRARKAVAKKPASAAKAGASGKGPVARKPAEPARTHPAKSAPPAKAAGGPKPSPAIAKSQAAAPSQ